MAFDLRALHDPLSLRCAVLGVCLFVGCAGEPDKLSDESTASVSSTPGAAAPAAVAEEPEESESKLVVFLGDSLTAGYGLDAEQAFPYLVGELLREEGRDVKVVNAGVSGDTTAGGLTRLDWLLRQRPDVLVVGLGGNDGLRGLDLAASESNLRRIVETAQEAGVQVLLLGMLIPPNYGPDYTEAFAAMYPRLAAEQGVALVPFLLDGVAGDPELNQADGIHPNPAGQRIVANTVALHLREVLDALEPPKR